MDGETVLGIVFTGIIGIIIFGLGYSMGSESGQPILIEADSIRHARFIQHEGRLFQRVPLSPIQLVEGK